VRSHNLSNQEEFLMENLVGIDFLLDENILVTDSREENEESRDIKTPNNLAIQNGATANKKYHNEILQK
jgi:hypothetical protein